MVDSALVWIGLLALVGILWTGWTLRRYTKTGELNFWGVGGVCITSAGVIELSVANGYVIETMLSTISGGLLIVLGLACTVVALRRRGLNTGRSSESL